MSMPEGIPGMLAIEGIPVMAGIPWDAIEVGTVMFILIGSIKMNIGIVRLAKAFDYLKVELRQGPADTGTQVYSAR